MKKLHWGNLREEYENVVASEALKKLHKGINIKSGFFNDEIPEMELAYRYIRPEYSVLEFGGNIGRNSITIASLLNKNRDGSVNLVTLETGDVSELRKNMESSGNKFTIINAGLSKKDLYQSGWVSGTTKDRRSQTKFAPEQRSESKDTAKPYNNKSAVNKISLSEIYKISGINKFDTLIVDCEGCFYDITNDFPELLLNSKLIIIENDSQAHNDHIRKNILNAGFKSIFCGDHEGRQPCFYEVFTK